MNQTPWPPLPTAAEILKTRVDTPHPAPPTSPTRHEVLVVLLWSSWIIAAAVLVWALAIARAHAL